MGTSWLKEELILARNICIISHSSEIEALFSKGNRINQKRGEIGPYGALTLRPANSFIGFVHSKWGYRLKQQVNELVLFA